MTQSDIPNFAEALREVAQLRNINELALIEAFEQSLSRRIPATSNPTSAWRFTSTPRAVNSKC